MSLISWFAAVAMVDERRAPIEVGARGGGREGEQMRAVVDDR